MYFSLFYVLVYNVVIEKRKKKKLDNKGAPMELEWANSMVNII